MQKQEIQTWQQKNVLCDEKTQQQVASKFLKDIQSKSESEAIQLSTLGSSMQVSFNSHAKTYSSASSSKLCANDVISMQVNARLRDRQLLKLLKDFRVKLGKYSVESNIRSLLVERKTVFADIFTKDMLGLKDSKGDDILRPFVSCNGV